MKKTTAAITLGTAAASIALGLGATSFARAADPTASTPSVSQASPPTAQSDTSRDNTSQGTPADGPSDRGPGGRGHGPGGHGIDSAKLANKLGVSEDKVKSALDNARPAPPSKDDSTSSSETHESAPEDTTLEEREAEHVQRQTETLKALASELGVSEDRVESALDELESEAQAERQAAFDQRIDSAVSDGTLTEAEGAAVKKAFEKGVLGGPGR